MVGIVLLGMVGIPSWYIYTLYHPGYTTVLHRTPVYLYLRTPCACCRVRVAWAQERNNPWVRGSSEG